MENITLSAEPTILIINDRPACIEGLLTILFRNNYLVNTISRGNTALPAVQDTSPGLILINPNLPDLSGYAVCRLLKTVPDTADIPIIFIECSNIALDKQKVFDMGGVDYLESPFQEQEVLSRIKTHITLGQLQQKITHQAVAFKELTMRWQNELAVARNIQQGLLPSPRPAWPGLKAVCFTQSAREVGGDFYTYHAFDTRLHVNDRRFSLAVGDVSGKGMPAALLMAISLASFKNLITQEYSLNKLVTDMVTETYSLSQFLIDLDKAIAFYTSATRQNCALVYVELTKPTRAGKPVTMRAVNAGCIAPLICPAKGDVYWVDVGGMPLGSGAGSQFGYREETLTLSAGDFVILTSDGVVEATNREHGMLGFDRLEEIVRSSPKHNASIMMEHIYGEVMDFVGNTELHDDLTIVVIQV